MSTLSSDKPLTIRKATASDIPALLVLWDATRTSLRERGIDHFQHDARIAILEGDIKDRVVYIVAAADGDDADIITTITLCKLQCHQSSNRR